MIKQAALSGLAVMVVLGADLNNQAQGVTSSYAYAQQRIDNLVLSRVGSGPLNEVPNTLATDTSTTAIVVDTPGGVDGHLDNLDAALAYVGPLGTAPAENNFAQKGAVNADYARGDVQIGNDDLIGAQAGGLIDNVAESYLADPISGAQMDDGFGLGQWTISTRFRLPTNGSIDITLDFANGLVTELVDAQPGSLAEASYSFLATIVNHDTGAQVFSWEPTELNQTHAVTVDDVFSEFRSGPLSTMTDLERGEYELTFSGNETVNTTVNTTLTVIPEPVTGSLGMIGVGAVTVCLRRRRMTA